MKPRTTGRIILVAMVTVTLAWSGFAIWLQSMLYPGPLQQETTLMLPSGAGTGEIARILGEAGVVARPWEFKLASRARFADRTFQAGEYTFEPRISLQKVIQKISGGDVISRSVTIPEGKTYEEIREILLSTPGLYGPPLAFAEGALLPETYHFRYGAKVVDIMREMARSMTATVNEAWEGRDVSIPLKSPEELLILASIIEKETSIAEEQPVVASVYINRLKKGMRLEADPTVIYGASDYKGNLRTKHLREDQPYNTYVHKGLPPTPICNPGKGAIYAAAHPANTNYLFFVADGTGGHVFATQYADHRRNVQAMLDRQRKARRQIRSQQAAK